MRTAEKTTKAGELEYPVTFQQFETLEEILEQCKGNEDQLVAIVNAAQEQGAKQGGKEDVRKAILEANGDLKAPKVDEAVSKHQERAARYIIGAPRGSGGRAVTKTKARELGANLHELLTDEQLAALAAEHGLEV